MRTAILTILVLGLMASPAWAIGGGGKNKPKDAKLKIVSKVTDSVVYVGVNGSVPVALEPGASTTMSLPVFGGDQVGVNVSASLTEDFAVSVSRSATIKTGKTTTATITGPPLDITFSGQGLVAALLSRETGVALASSGGLMSLLWLSFLLGRKPRRREGLGDLTESLDHVRSGEQA